MINLRFADDEEAMVQHIVEVETIYREVVHTLKILNRALEVQELLIRLCTWSEDERMAALAAALTLTWISGEGVEDACSVLCLDLIHTEVTNNEESTLLSALAKRATESSASELLIDIVRIAAWFWPVYRTTTNVVWSAA